MLRLCVYSNTMHANTCTYRVLMWSGSPAKNNIFRGWHKYSWGAASLQLECLECSLTAAAVHSNNWSRMTHTAHNWHHPTKLLFCFTESTLKVSTLLFWWWSRIFFGCCCCVQCRRRDIVCKDPMFCTQETNMLFFSKDMWDRVCKSKMCCKKGALDCKVGFETFGMGEPYLLMLLWGFSSGPPRSVLTFSYQGGTPLTARIRTGCPKKVQFEGEPLLPKVLCPSPVHVTHKSVCFHFENVALVL